jgi:catalase
VAAGLAYRDPIEPVAAAVAARTDLKPSPALSILKKAKTTIAGRKVGCLITDGADATLVKALAAAVEAEGGQLKLVAPQVGGAVGNDGKPLEADFQLAGGPSVLFDAVVLIVSAEGTEQLAREAVAVGFVHDAFAHLKVIGHTAAAAGLLAKAGVPASGDEGVIPIEGSEAVGRFVAAVGAGRLWEREPKVRLVF